MHKQLDMIHKEAFDMAFNELRATYEEFEAIGTLRKAAAAASKRADVNRANELTQQADKIEQAYLPKLKRDFKKRQNKN